MNTVLRHCLGKFCFVYLDDIVIYFKNIQEHFEHLKQLFDVLEAAGLTLNLSKCNMLQKSITFLGHVVSAEGVRTETAKVEAVQNFPVSTTLKEVQRFLGLAGGTIDLFRTFPKSLHPCMLLRTKMLPGSGRWTASRPLIN